MLVCNRTGHEADPSGQTDGIRFWGGSAVIGPQGEILAQAPGDAAEVLLCEVDTARAFQAHGEPEPDANQELLALGLANIGGGLLQAMPSGGGTSQTAVNDQAGAKSQIAEVVTVAVVVVTLPPN